ncbi:hypothetical protein KGP36_06860 [Patescibacteria group bacterium]|nr:hypothetical protein [Patescibacteria group bacterium]
MTKVINGRTYTHMTPTGQPARILCEDLMSSCPIVVAYLDDNGTSEEVSLFSRNVLKPFPVTYTKFANIHRYPGGELRVHAILFDTKEKAMAQEGDLRVATVPVTWDE